MLSGKRGRTVKAPSPSSNSGDETVLDIDGRRVQCTRLNKLLYPAAHFTKAQVIDYYVRVAPFLLPHLHDRPVTLKRYPDGVHAQAYWEKDAPNFTPDWAERFPVPRHAGGPDIKYILINNTATLAWTANVAALELHPFLHRAPEIQTPTSVVFDLDPGEGADIFTCIEVALRLSDVFDRLGLQLFPKVSGSKGIQVYLPLNTPTTYDVTQPFARSIAQLIESDNPNLAVSEMPKEKRIGKVFIDWSQNADFKTTVGVYSLRAKRERPFVSMPVTWPELRSAHKRKNAAKLYFDPKQALARLEQIGDLFAPVLSLKQQLPADVVEHIREQNRRSSRMLPARSEHGHNGVSSAEGKQLAVVPRRSTQGSKRRFVVQQHAARQVHFDFRLEMNDVLRSWAVPKGVPYEPGVRRLASATEDHPLSYLAFEGIIPEGQYGAGTVMVWDIGTYEVIEGNYWKGFLHISLAGKKLHGEWKLMRDPAKGKTSWLLEKVEGDMEPPADAQKSALTGRTLQQIAESRDAVWQSNRVANTETLPKRKEAGATEFFPELQSLREAKPGFIEPMQCKLVPKLPEGAQWEYEAKFDGYRALVVRNGEVAILSRRNSNLTRDFPMAAKAFEAAPDKTVVDGELIALDQNGKPAFNVLQNRRLHRDRVQYYAFDLLVYQGRSLLCLPLQRRRELLKAALESVTAPVHFSESFTANPADLMVAAREAGFEGIIAKRRDSPYEPGKRSGLWSKLKFYADQELVIGGYLPGPHKFDALLVGHYEKNRLIFTGKIRNGFSILGTKERVFARFRGLGADKCPFDNLPEPANARRGMSLTAEAMKLCCWLKPKLVAQVGIREWTEDGHMRHSPLRTEIMPSISRADQGSGFTLHLIEAVQHHFLVPPDRNVCERTSSGRVRLAIHTGIPFIVVTMRS